MSEPVNRPEPEPAHDPDSARDPGAAYDAMLERDAAKSAKRRQSHSGGTQGWSATGTLLSGIIVWGLIGWGLAYLTDWRPFIAIGVLLGAALGVYLVTKQAGDPPPLMDISKAQDGGILGRMERHQQKLSEGEDTSDERHTP